MLTDSVRKLVAVGIVRLSFMKRASVAPGPRIGFAPGGGVFAGAASRRRAAVPVDERQHVVLGHLAAAPAALDAREVEPVRVRDPDCHRRRVRPAVAGRRRLRTAARWSSALQARGLTPLLRRARCGRRSCPTARSRPARPGSRPRRRTRVRGSRRPPCRSRSRRASRPPRPRRRPACATRGPCPPGPTRPSGAARRRRARLRALASRPGSWPPRGPSRSRRDRSGRRRSRRRGGRRRSWLSSPPDVSGAGLPPSVSISPRTVPTGTVSSASTRIRTSVPPTGAGTSASTLSVETSRSVSLGSTWSPTCLSHSSTVPSVTESPIWGMVICTVVPASI